MTAYRVFIGQIVSHRINNHHDARMYAFYDENRKYIEIWNTDFNWNQAAFEKCWAELLKLGIKPDMSNYVGMDGSYKSYTKPIF